MNSVPFRWGQLDEAPTTTHLAEVTKRLFERHWWYVCMVVRSRAYEVLGREVSDKELAGEIAIGSPRGLDKTYVTIRSKVILEWWWETPCYSVNPRLKIKYCVCD